ncbi:MAG TPA: alpha-amylase [Tepidisphaeraceae bacterium]|nr:alpha-amylase [Tepidisphaeraceae bacterium]
MNRGVMAQYFEWNLPKDGTLWTHLAEHAIEISNLGITAVWMPPAYKSMDGGGGTGYGVYDLYDVGEFDQKGSVRTKYGTREQYLAAVKAVQDAGMHVYADVVFNHRMGGDETEEVEIEEIDQNDRNIVATPPYKIHAWSHFKFQGRGDQYSPLKLHWQHFNAFGSNADAPNERKIFRIHNKSFSGDVSFEMGNFDYLMGADVDVYHPEVREDLFRWGKWYLETFNVNGFRLDAIKHIPSHFFKDWFEYLRKQFPDREIFAVGEYWTGDVGQLHHYLSVVGGIMRLFDVPLHFNFYNASKGPYDLSKIFDGTFVKDNPLMAVTFVDNHDSQPGQGLESFIEDWFKPLAYALILLRQDGYPCLFYGDYFGNPDPNTPLTAHRKLIDDFLQARAKFTYGDQHDYFDHPTCVGWVWSGDAEHPGSLAVVLNTGHDPGVKRMKTYHGQCTFRDLTGHWQQPVTTDENGEADFPCPARGLSVWCMC